MSSRLMNKQVSLSKANSNTPTNSDGSNEEETKKFFSYYFYTPAMWAGGIGLVLILVLFGTGAFQEDRILSCPSTSSVPCGNPYYEFGCTDNEYCGVRFITPGEEYVLVESSVPVWVSYAYNVVVWGLLLMGFFRNYRAYQRGLL